MSQAPGQTANNERLMDSLYPTTTEMIPQMLELLGALLKKCWYTIILSSSVCCCENVSCTRLTVICWMQLNLCMLYVFIWLMCIWSKQAYASFVIFSALYHMNNVTRSPDVAYVSRIKSYVRKTHQIVYGIELLHIQIKSYLQNSVEEGLVWVFSSDLIMGFTDGFVGCSSAESTVYAVESVKVSPEQYHLQVLWNGWCLPDMLAVSRPPLLHYLDWSAAQVNYRGAPESCVTKDGRQNTVKLPCPVQKKTRGKITPA